MTWSSNLSRIRRFLRDPNGKIWADALLRNLFNDSARDLQQKTNCLEDVQVVRVPPLYEMSYLQDWEWAYLGSTTGNYSALRYHQQSDIAFCYRWEPQAVWGEVDATAPDEGDHFTQPWEAWYASSAGDIIPIPFPPSFHTAKLVAWDKEPIEYMELKGIQQDDPSWLGRSGEPFAYWRPDKCENQFCLYPFPSEATWDDVEVAEPDPDYVYTYDFEESEAYFTGTDAAWTREDTNYSRRYIFDWEASEDDTVDGAVARGMYQHEQGIGAISDYGIGDVLFKDGDEQSSEFGTTVDYDGTMVSTEYGITLDEIDADNNVLFVYSMVPAK